MEAPIDQYVRLDVSVKDTAISIRENRKRLWRERCSPNPKDIADPISKRAPYAKRVVFETGPLSTWCHHAFTAMGLPAICIEARHEQRVLSETPNKTDANDADGLAHLAEAGFYKEVRVKAFDSMLTRTLVSPRDRLISIATQLSNQIRGLMKTFGLILPSGTGRVFDGKVREFLTANDNLAAIVLQLLAEWRDVRKQAAGLDRQLIAAARKSRPTKLLMTIPGIGAVTALAYVEAIEDPENFRNSRSVGA